MKTEQLRDELHNVMLLASGGDMINAYMAQAVIDHITPMMKTAVSYMEHQYQCEFKTSFTKDCTCGFHEALESISEEWRK